LESPYLVITRLDSRAMPDAVNVEYPPVLDESREKQIKGKGHHHSQENDAVKGTIGR